MKVSNAAEDPATLDMEASQSSTRCGWTPGCPSRSLGRSRGRSPDTADPTARRALHRAADGDHHVRMYDVLPGRHRDRRRSSCRDAALADWGATTARLGRALRGFFHPAAQRTMLWDIQHAARTRELLGAIRDDRHRALVERVLDRFESAVVPVWPSFRAQVVHGDLTTDNALVRRCRADHGIVDFGDMSHYRARDRPRVACSTRCSTAATGDELFRAARLVLDGYQRVTPLEPLELALSRRAAGDPGGRRRSRSRRGARSAVSRTRPSPSATTRRSRRRSRRCSTSAGTRSPGGSAPRSTRLRRRPAWPRGARRHSGRRSSRCRYDRAAPVVERERRLDDRRRTGVATSTPTTTSPCVGTATRGSPRRSPARPAASTPTCATSTRPRSSSPSGSSRRCRPDRASTPCSSSTPARRPTTSRGGWRPRSPGPTARCARRSPTTASPTRPPRCRPSHGRRAGRPPTSRHGRRRTASAATDLDGARSRRRSPTSPPAGIAPAAAILDGVLTSDGFLDRRPGLAAELGRPDPRGRWPVDRRRGPGRSRPDRRRDVVVRAARDRRPTS